MESDTANQLFSLTPRALVEEAWEQEFQDLEMHLRLSQYHARKLDILAALGHWAASPNQRYDLLLDWLKELLALEEALSGHVLLPSVDCWLPRNEAERRIMESFNSVVPSKEFVVYGSDQEPAA